MEYFPLVFKTGKSSNMLNVLFPILYMQDLFIRKL